MRCTDLFLEAVQAFGAQAQKLIRLLRRQRPLYI